MRIRTVLTAVALAATAVLGGATAAAADPDPGFGNVVNSQGISVLPVNVQYVDVPVTLECNAVDVLGNAPC
ncbi:chaplin [Streptomyces sp. NBC_00203]|uniref:chaplin n=1 Tax=Streptomyces sp. NBC_00203 TaxID=2975680 RepID=UPI003254D71F